MAIATAVVIAGLAIAGFVYGKVRSRVPAASAPTTPATSESAVDSRDDGTAADHDAPTDAATAPVGEPAAPARAGHRVGAADVTRRL